MTDRILDRATLDEVIEDASIGAECKLSARGVLCLAWEARDSRRRFDAIRALLLDQRAMHRANSDPLDVTGRIDAALRECAGQGAP